MDRTKDATSWSNRSARVPFLPGVRIGALLPTGYSVLRRQSPGQERKLSNGPLQAAGLRAARKDTGRAAGPPGHRRRKPDRVGKDDTDSPDPPRGRLHREGHGRRDPAAAHRGRLGVGVHCAADPHDDPADRRLHDALRGQDRRRNGHQGDDGRDPPAGAEERPPPVAVQRPDGGRGARAQPQHRLHPRDAEGHPRRAPRVPRHRLLGNHQRGDLFRVLRRLPRRQHRRPDVPRRGDLRAARDRGGPREPDGANRGHRFARHAEEGKGGHPHLPPRRDGHQGLRADARGPRPGEGARAPAPVRAPVPRGPGAGVPGLPRQAEGDRVHQHRRDQHHHRRRGVGHRFGPGQGELLQPEDLHGVPHRGAGFPRLLQPAPRARGAHRARCLLQAVHEEGPRRAADVHDGRDPPHRSLRGRPAHGGARHPRVRSRSTSSLPRARTASGPPWRHSSSSTP